MQKTQTKSIYVALTKINEELTEKPFVWDTTDLEQEVFSNEKN